jgi:hypothetical protein
MCNTMGLLYIVTNGLRHQGTTRSGKWKRGNTADYGCGTMSLESEQRRDILLYNGVLTSRQELQPRAFSIMPLVFTLGAVFGPV